MLTFDTSARIGVGCNLVGHLLFHHGVLRFAVKAFVDARAPAQENKIMFSV
jgi:hypothetical protein